MKQKIINGIVIVIIVVVMAALLFPWPKDFNKEFTGVKYQYGSGKDNYEEQVNIKFVGEFHESYFGLLADRFTGNIFIDGVEVYNDKEFELSFDENRSTIIKHRCYVQAQMTMKIFNYGKLYFDEDLNSLVIELFDDYSKSTFDKTDGYVLVAPAESKEDAFGIVDELLGEQ